MTSHLEGLAAAAVPTWPIHEDADNALVGRIAKGQIIDIGV